MKPYCIDSSNPAGLGTCESSGTCDFTEGGGETAEGCSGESAGSECGGGIVASQESGYTLIAATADNHVGIQWGCKGDYTGAISTTDGITNTSTILSNCATRPIAASVCDSYEGGDYTDWYLPATTELSTLYTNLHLESMGSFTDDYYWSSTEYQYNPDSAWYKRFLSGAEGFSDKLYMECHVRCVRRYSE